MRTVNVNTIGEYIRQQREQAKISLRQLAQAAGVSNPYLSQIERGLRRPSAEILQQIAKGLRISAEALYVQAGILEDRPSDSGVRTAVLTDPGLSERQKQILLEIYESFRSEFAGLRARLNGVAGPAEADGAAAGPAESADMPAGVPAALAGSSADVPAGVVAGLAGSSADSPAGVVAGSAASAGDPPAGEAVPNVSG
jgi:transcriptional regulator with XRE-family HTH domain